MDIEPLLQSALQVTAAVVPRPEAFAGAVDPRRLSPRRQAAWAHDLYIEGRLSWAEYRLVGFPAELHPGWDATIGALTGERAEPDRPRDMIAEWEHRLAFDRRHCADAPHLVLRTERILSLLRQSETVRPPSEPAPRMRLLAYGVAAE